MTSGRILRKVSLHHCDTPGSLKRVREGIGAGSWWECDCGQLWEFWDEYGGPGREGEDDQFCRWVRRASMPEETRP